MAYEYLVLMGACLVATLPLEAWLGVRVYRRPRRLAMAVAGGAAPFLAWDLAAARLGHWDYTASRVVGLWLLGLPVEEYLFFLVVPVCAILAYEAVAAALPARRAGGCARAR